MFPTPGGWFARDLSKVSIGSFWDLYEHNPAARRDSGLGITIRTGPASEETRSDVSRCPRHIEETKIIRCGFVRFNGHRWRRIVGHSDSDFVDYALVEGSGNIRIIGFPDRGFDRLGRVDALIKKALISSIPGYVIGRRDRVPPEYREGGGAAGACGGPTPGDLAVYILGTDTPLPRCGVATGNQRLRIINHLDRLAVLRLGHLVLFVPADRTVTVREPFRKYLRPGGYVIDTNAYGGGPELRLRP